MKNYYHKAANIAVISVCTAIGLVLGVTEAVKAATFTFAPTIIFQVKEGRAISNNFDVVANGPFGKVATFAEYNLGDFSLDATNTTINRAVFETPLHSVWVGGSDFGIEGAINSGSLGIFGYVGNGTAEASDFEAGIFLGSFTGSRQTIDNFAYFNVGLFLNRLVSNKNELAGFALRSLMENTTFLTRNGYLRSGCFPKCQ